MELNSKTKFINFKEFYHGEAYVRYSLILCE